MSKRVIVIHGATGIGKTACAIKVAQGLGCDIINADSRQIYKEMSIGTAVPSSEELSAINHHLVQSHSVEDKISAGRYEELVLEILEELFLHNDYVVMVGGSGMYINAALYGMDEIPSDAAIREQLADLSVEELAEMLKGLDREYYQVVDTYNRNRVMRGVEVCLATGKKYSELRTGEKKDRDFEVLQFALDRPREELYDRINKRVDIMIEQGLESEAKAVEAYKELPALKTVGYREMFDYFDGKIDLQTAIELIKRNSRRYAKRQYTWIRAQEGIIWVQAEDVDGILRIIKHL